MKLTVKDIAERYNTSVSRVYYYLNKVIDDSYKKPKGKNPVMYDEEIVLRVGNLIQDATILKRKKQDKEYWRQKSIRLQKENNNLKMEINAIENIKDSIKLLNDLDNQKVNQKEDVASFNKSKSN